MTIQTLVKMKCCVVCASGFITLALVLLGHNMINAGISGTVALIYGIALAMFVSIAMYDKCVNKGCLEEHYPNTE